MPDRTGVPSSQVNLNVKVQFGYEKKINLDARQMSLCHRLYCIVVTSRHPVNGNPRSTAW